MLAAVSAEAVRIHNGSNHHLLKFALICSLHATGSRRLVSIFSYGLRSGLSCNDVSLSSSTAHDILRLQCHLYKTTWPNTVQRALIEERKGYEDAQNRSKDTQKTRSLSEAVRSGTVGLRHVW